MKKETSSKNYVLTNLYGYGQEEETQKLNKLKLRNYEDVCVYVDDVVVNTFNATYKHNIIQFKTDKCKCKIVIKRI